MQFPQSFLNSLNGIKGFDRKAFENAHVSNESITSIRINPLKLSSLQISSFGGDLGEAVPWTQYGYYLKERPSFTFDPLFHAGCYYVQEASSMFLEQALKQTADLSKSLKILDLCAAPGGKSTHIQTLITKDSLLVSNEVIRSRANILRDNIIKWGCENVGVTNNDPKDFAKLENYFDVIIVDAPCSGSGLFRKEPEAVKEWSLNNVQLCCRRQQRILADVWPSLKKEGVLIYSTCSYSKEEDEGIVDWLKKELPNENCPLQIDKNWGIVESDTGYRFWPDKVKGEGFFIACFQKKEGNAELNFGSKRKQQAISKKEISIIHEWIKKGNCQLLKRSNTVYTIPENLSKDVEFLQDQLNMQYFGVKIGELIRDKLIPDHALAMSNIVNENVPTIELNYDQSIEFLRKKEIKLDTKFKGWSLVNFHGHQLGWINILQNRINNYYPKELRILKDR